LHDRVPTSLLSALGLITGFGTATGTGSRPAGGVVMALFGLTCIYFWVKRDGNATALRLTLVGLTAFVLSHVIGMAIGAWPAVLLVSAVTAWLCWRWSDEKVFRSAAGPLPSS
jgi:multisubunit Na+/H+ antiporter MnhG subunit